jgi:hypothetical protein
MGSRRNPGSLQDLVPSSALAVRETRGPREARSGHGACGGGGRGAVAGR